MGATMVVVGQGVVQLGVGLELNRVQKLTTFIQDAKLGMPEEVLEVGVKCLQRTFPKLEASDLGLN